MRPRAFIRRKGTRIKTGKTTDYVKRQYIGNLGKIEKGIVSVNAYGYYEGITFPLIFKVFKPKERLKEGDHYQTQPVLASEIIKELRVMGFQIQRVLADSLYGESESNFLSVVEEFNLEYAVAIRYLTFLLNFGKQINQHFCPFPIVMVLMLTGTKIIPWQ